MKTQERLKNNNGAGGSGAGAKRRMTEAQVIARNDKKHELVLITRELEQFDIHINRWAKKEEIMKLCVEAKPV